MQDSNEQTFYKIVPEAFGFLSEYGFSLQKGEFGNYTAKSDKCFIKISLDWDGINITLGPNKIDRSQFETQPRTIELSRVIRYLNPSATKEPY